MNVAPSTAAQGTCTACSSPLAAGQRYCIACGERRAELPAPFRPPEREPVPELRVSAPLLGARRSFGAVGTVVLACGVLIGAAVGPALTPSSLAATAGQIIVVSTDALGAAGTVASGAATGASASSNGLAAPTGNVAAPANKVVNRGGGSSPPAAAASAPPSSPSAPAATVPADPSTPSTPTTPAEDPTVAGTVVHLSHGGRGYAVATKEGQLIALHTAKEPALGDKLTTTVTPLENGTFAQVKATVSGHVEKAKFHGTVTYADPVAGVYTVSAPAVSLLVHLLPPVPPAPADPAGATPAPPPPAVPAVGTATVVAVAIKPAPDPNAPDPNATDPKGTPWLEETKREDGDPASGDLDLEAIVRAPDPTLPPDPSHLVVSVDDAGESPATLSLKVPATVGVSKLRKSGTVISALVKLEADGSYTLVSATDDSTRKSANRPAP